MSNLVVIEAVGKLSTLSRNLRAIRFEAEVCATKGLLYALPNDRLGLAPDTLTPCEWVPVNTRIIQDIAAAAKRADRVFILTDSDVEGELIAGQIRGLLLQHEFDGQIHRCHANTLTPDALREALAAPGDVSRRICMQAIARRAVDRAVGFLLSDTARNFNAVVGRVRAQILASIKHKPVPVWRLAGSHDSAPGWRIHAQGSPEQVESLRALEAAFKAQDPELFGRAAARPVVAPPPAPPIGAEILLLVCTKLGVSVREAEQLVQQQYESGSLSYPRSDSRTYTLATQAHLKAIARQSGISVRRDVGQWESPGEAQGAHEAVHALEGDPRIGVSLAALHRDDALQTLLLRRSIMPLCPDAEVIREQVPTRAIAVFLEARRLPQVRCTIWKDTPDTAGWTVLEKGTAPPAQLEQIPTDVAVLTRLIDDNIGRPSTAGIHVDTVVRNRLIQDGQLSRSGFANFSHITAVAPSLASEHNLDHYLAAHEATDLAEMIDGGLIHLGLRPADLRAEARDRAMAAEQQRQQQAQVAPDAAAPSAAAEPPQQQPGRG